MSFAIIRTSKHGAKRSCMASLTHQLRERETKNADESKTHLNINSHSTSTDAWANIESRFEGAKMQKAATRAIEYLITTSNEVPENFDAQKYMEDALKFIEDKHGKENVVFSSFQYDERTPHLAVMVVPRVHVEEQRKERTIKHEDGTSHKVPLIIPAHDKISAREFLNGKEKLIKLQDDFSNQVGAKHGLERGAKGSTATHINVDEYYAKLNAALELGAKIERNLPKPSDYEAASNGQKSARILDMEKFYTLAPVITNENRTYKKRAKELEKRSAILDAKENKLNKIELENVDKMACIRAAINTLQALDPKIEDKVIAAGRAAIEADYDAKHPKIVLNHSALKKSAALTH